MYSSYSNNDLTRSTVPSYILSDYKIYLELPSRVAKIRPHKGSGIHKLDDNSKQFLRYTQLSHIPITCGNHHGHPAHATPQLSRRPLSPQRHGLRPTNHSLHGHPLIIQASTDNLSSRDHYAAGFMIGKVTLHTWSSAIDLEIPGPPLAMQKTSKLSSNYDVHGNNINWRWERDRALTSDIHLVDYTSGGVLARFENASFSVKRQGT